MEIFQHPTTSQGMDRLLPPGNSLSREPQVKNTNTMRSDALVCKTDDDDDDSLKIVLFDIEERQVVDIELPVGNNATETTAAGSGTTTRDPTTLSLRQYNSQHAEWGIHSTIWDGGLALLVYLLDRCNNKNNNNSTSQESCTSTDNTNHSLSAGQWDFMLDLGSGTGLVGLGIVAATATTIPVQHVALTDTAQALKLLNDNIHRNSHLLLVTNNNEKLHGGQSRSLPQAHVLDWTNPQEAMTSWMPTFFQQEQHSAQSAMMILNNNTTTTNTRILLTGADIVYRPSLFEPLLSTLDYLFSSLPSLIHKTTTNSELTSVECLLACQSIRTHFHNYWKLAQRKGFGLEIIAVVDLNDDNKLNLNEATLRHDKDDDFYNPNPREGRILIVRVSK